MGYSGSYFQRQKSDTLPAMDETFIDLFATETACTFAFVYQVMGEKLEEISVNIMSRIKERLCKLVQLYTVHGHVVNFADSTINVPVYYATIYKSAKLAKNGETLEMSFGSDFDFEIEKVKYDDRLLIANWGENLYRIIIKFRAKADKITYTIK